MKDKKIIPRGKNVLVKPNDEESKINEFGIVIPDNEEQEKKAIGTVISMGRDVGDDINVGDTVIYGVFAGEQIKFKDSQKDTDFVLLLDDEILAIIKDK